VASVHGITAYVALRDPGNTSENTKMPDQIYEVCGGSQYWSTYMGRVVARTWPGTTIFDALDRLALSSSEDGAQV
jgi:hypothetical protein